MTTNRSLGIVDGLAQLSFAVIGLLEARARHADLSLVQMRMLGVLRDRRPTINELATLLQLDKSSTSGLVDRASRRDLVRRVPADHDRRAVRVELTGSGRELATNVADGFGNDVIALLRPLTAADRRALSALVDGVLVAAAETRGIDLFAAHQDNALKDDALKDDALRDDARDRA
ncbi:MarR family winged helix-turn-helix transcriptional regulator [uncultured Jatrophihabitans sp.]|uniref:MarR family winged helix-turn-helix transcriptional regulator n=1 Tax=uncultured Jatrophihabitans sp. TaxID=1610747 RepID=UPI0035CAA271